MRADTNRLSEQPGEGDCLHEGIEGSSGLKSSPEAAKQLDQTLKTPRGQAERKQTSFLYILINSTSKMYFWSINKTELYSYEFEKLFSHTIYF